MKKLIVVLLLLSLAAGMAFADDALVMPKGVIRAYFLGTYGMFDTIYDEDGEEQDHPFGETSYFNQGFAVELGVTEQVTAAVQWVPGSNIYSESDTDPLAALPYPDNTNLVTSGLGDLFVGSKIQILGDKGFVKNDQFRFSMAPGVQIPLDSYDGEEELDNYTSGDDWRYSGRSHEAFGIGSRFYFDYIVNKNFFVNLYSEMIYNFPVDKETTAVTDALAPITEKEYKYGTDMVFELEGKYTHYVTDKSNIYFGLPINYEINPDVEVDGTTVDDSGMKYLQLRPILGYFCGDTMIPFDASLRYGFPLYGENSSKMQTITLQVKVYARLFD